MPRWVDFSKLNKSVFFETPRLDPSRYGAHELDAMRDIWPRVEDRVWEQTSGLLPSQFKDCRHTAFAPELLDNLENAFSWLNKNVVHPWEWNESSTTGGGRMSLNFNVYVERIPDQQAFHKAFPKLFSYTPSTPLELTTVALLSGVIPATDVSDVARKIPDDFTAYINGEVDTYAASHVRSSRPSTAQIIPFIKPPTNK